MAAVANMFASSSALEAGAAPSRHHAPLAAVLAAAAAGIAVGQLLDDRGVRIGAAVWWTIAGASLWAWWRLWRWKRRGAAVCLLLAVAALAGLWRHARWNLFESDHLARCATVQRRPVALEVTAVSGPRYEPAAPFDPFRGTPAEERTRLTVSAAAVRDGAAWRPAAGRATLTVIGRLENVAAGDRLRVFGQLSRPDAPLNPGAFDFAGYYRADRVLVRLSAERPECVTRVRQGPWWAPWSLVQRLRSAGDRVLWRHLQHARSGLAAALLLGLREELPDARAEAFVVTGTIHLLVVSGMHVSMVVALLVWAQRGGLLPRRTALLLTAAVAVGYTLVTNAEPPAVRAAVMVALLCWGWYLRRPQVAWNALAAAALVVLVINPADLFRSGPQLSLLCVAALLALDGLWQRCQPEDPLDRLIRQSRPWPVRAARAAALSAGQALLISAALWGVTAPLLAARFHLISPATIVLSPLLAAPVAAALVSGLALVVCGAVPPLAWPLAAVCDASLRFTEAVVQTASALPGSHLWAPGPPGWWLAGFYGLLAAWLLWPNLRPTRRWAAATLCGWSTVGLAAGWIAPPERALRCTFVSVGHGLAVLLELPSGRTLLYDAGQLGAPQRAADAVAGCLWQRGRLGIDALLISHADADHFNGVPELLRRFRVGSVLVSPQMAAHTGDLTGVLLELCRQQGVPARTISAGQRLRCGEDVQIRALAPDPVARDGRDNAHSLVLLVEYQGRRILLTGDLETPGLESLLAQPPIDCDVALAPHHGSPRSDPPGLLAWCRAEHVVISGEHREAGEAIRRAYGAAGARVWTTGRDGAVQATIRDGQVEVRSFR